MEPLKNNDEQIFELENTSETTSETTSEIEPEISDESLLTVNDVENILWLINPELNKQTYVTYDFPWIDEILSHKYSIINIKQFLNSSTENDTDIGHFIIIINCRESVIVYPLYYIRSKELEEYLKIKCGFKSVVWCYNVIQHGNSKSCGWICCKIAYDYFSKNKIEVECKEYCIHEI